MSSGSGTMRFACRLVIVLWLGAYFGWLAADRPPPVEVAQALARVRPAPEPPKPPSKPDVVAEKKPEPPPPTQQKPKEKVKEKPKAEPKPPTRQAQPTRVGSSEIRAGGRLLDGAGRFPALSCSYDDFPSFRAYAGAMNDLGARFVVVRNRGIVGSVDLDSGELREASVDGAFSPRARDYTGEPGLAVAARKVRGRFGHDAVIMMLVPRELDAGLFGGIAGALAKRGDDANGYREIRGRYERAPGGGVRLRVDTGIRRSGEEVAVGLLFDLNEIARLGGRGGSTGPRA